MFEKIFGIFRKGKKSDFSAELPGETDEGDLFDMGDTGMDDDFDADTISLETGMTDGGFSGDSDGMSSDPTFGGLDSDGPDGGDNLEDGISDMGALQDPITPMPEMEPLGEEPAYMSPGAKKSIVGLIVTIAVVVVGLVVGFFVATPSSIEAIKRATSSEPTLLEQIDTLVAENAGLDGKLKAYRKLDTVDEINAVKEELANRRDISAKIAAIEAKIADRPAVEDRLDTLGSRLAEVRRKLSLQQGTFANVQKSLKQFEARNNYLISSTRERLDDLETATAQSEVLKARLDEELVRDAEAEAYITRDLQDKLGQAALEALSAL